MIRTIYLFRISLLMSLFLLIMDVKTASAKEYRTQTGEAGFTVSAPAATIFGKSNSVAITLDTKTQKISVEVLVNSFTFTNNFNSPEKNETIYERFNNRYMRSGDYPYVRYLGEIVNLSEINFKKDGVYTIRTKGKLTIGRATNEKEIEGVVTVSKGKVSVSAEIVVYPYQYKLAIPKFIGKMYFGEVQVATTAHLK